MKRTSLILMITAALSSSALAAPQPQTVQPGPILPQAQPTTCKLTYGNGPLMQHVKVFDVFYNKGNPYRDMLTTFYTNIVQSSYFDWLMEYNVTNYKIGRGSFLGFFEDSNSATAQTNLDDSQIGPYLDKLIAAGSIPAPDADTIYQIYFPASVTITQGGSQSCQVFCAYHNAYSHNGVITKYSVIPDVTQPPCAGGCGNSATQFNNLTSVSSHELIEAVTDPDVTGANPSGWYDTTNSCNPTGEIGDLCNGAQCKVSATASLTTCPGSSVVQLEWSNKNKACIAMDPSVVVNDFTVAASPATVNVPVGGMATTTVTLTKTAGTAENAALTAVNVPTGLTASFMPASVTSDKGTSMLTISAAPTAMVGATMKFSVKAAGSMVSPTADVMVMVVPPPDMAMLPDLAQPVNTGGGGNGGGGNGGGNGTGGNGMGGNGIGGNSSGCSIGAGGIGGSWAFAALLLLALAFRRRRA